MMRKLLSLLAIAVLFASTTAYAARTSVLPQGFTSPTVWTDGTRTDSFTSSGTITYPFTTISGMLAGLPASTNGYAMNLAPSTYVDGPPDTWSTLPTYISGNESTYVPVSGATFPGPIDMFDLTISGNVNLSKTSLTSLTQLNNGVLVNGTTKASGLTTFVNMAFSSPEYLITQPNSLVNALGTAFYGAVANNGTLNLDDDYMAYASSTGYSVTSTTTLSNLSVNGMTLISTSTGGGMNVQNAATSTPNSISALFMLTGVGAPSINFGTASTDICNVELYDVLGNIVPPTGSAAIPCMSQKILAFDSIAIGTTTSLATFQAAASSTSATTSVQLGASGRSKGTCTTFYDTAGSPVYMFFAAGASSPTYQNGGTTPSGCRN